MKRLVTALATLALTTSVSAQSLYIKDDNKKAFGPKVTFSTLVQNHNDYTQSYHIKVNGDVKKGKLTLQPGEARKINVVTKAKKKDTEQVHRICLVAIPLPTQLMGLALCQNVRTY